MIKLLKRRVVKSGMYSMQGLLASWKDEEAFRVEVILVLFLVPLALYLGETRVDKLLLTGCLFLVLIVELLNSAVESVVNRVGAERHELSGRAKDQGSAAVLIAMLLVLGVWTTVLWP